MTTTTQAQFVSYALLPLYKRTPQYGINLHLQEVNAANSKVLALLPVNNLKVTMSTGLTSNNVYMVSKSYKADVEYVFNIVNYDIRAKYYITNKLRVFIKMQVLGFGYNIPKNYYSCGILLKIKYK